MLASMANSARSMEAAARAFERRFGRTMPADLTDSEEEDQTEFYTRTFTYHRSEVKAQVTFQARWVRRSGRQAGWRSRRARRV